MAIAVQRVFVLLLPLVVLGADGTARRLEDAMVFGVQLSENSNVVNNNSSSSNYDRIRRSLMPFRMLGTLIAAHGELRTRHVPDICPFNTTCPDGSTARQTTFKLNPNGCGPEGLTSTSFLIPNEKVIHCCDRHDTCYATCGKSKKHCDNVLRDCVQLTCRWSKTLTLEQRSSCLLSASVFALLTRALGCAAFEDAQRDACVCPGRYLTVNKVNNNRDKLIPVRANVSVAV